MADARPALTSEELEALRRLTTPTVANAIETLALRSRAAGYMDPSVRAVVPGDGPLLGYACTATIRAAAPPGAGAEGGRRRLWEHVLSVPPPRVVVLQDLDDPPVGSFWGEVQANVYRALGCVGAVTNGGVRDLDEVRALGFRLFAGSVMVSHAYVHVVDVGAPVRVGELEVRPGDLLHGDQHGVTSVPLEVARALPEAAAAVERRERRIIELARAPVLDLDALEGVFDSST